VISLRLINTMDNTARMPATELLLPTPTIASC